jgi:hypothetical protein
MGTMRGMRKFLRSEGDIDTDLCASNNATRAVTLAALLKPRFSKDCVESALIGTFFKE